MREWLTAQFPSYILWLPFVFAAGIVTYFNLPFEPNIPYNWIIAGIISTAIISVIWRRHFINTLIYIPLMIALIFGAGFVYSYSYSHAITTPQIKHDIRNTEISGTVEQIDYIDGRARLYLKNVLIKNIFDKTFNVRVSLLDDMTSPQIGDTVTVNATLFKPEPADTYATFDYAELLYFRNTSAIGYLNSQPVVTGNIKTTSDFMHDTRQKIHNAIALGGNEVATGLADSLVLGFTSAIGRDANDYAKSAGIAHVFSISGFHITLVGGWLILLFYLLFRLIPGISRNIPARIPAVICAWFGLLFYLYLSGNAVATQRAFIMTTFMFVAFLFDRNVFSLRNVCICFFALLLANPHYLKEVGFQLSFAAIFGLVWYFGDQKHKKRSIIQKILFIIGVMILTDIICTIFTGPLVAYNFNYFPTYSLVGNLLCLPIFSFVIMPLVILGTFTSGIGWFAPMDLAARAYEFTISITKYIHELPYSQIQIPQIPGIALAILIIGFLCLMFLIASRRTRYIVFGTTVAAFIIITATNPRPILYVSNDHDLVAFMTDDGTLRFNHKSSYNNKFAYETWLKMNMENPESVAGRAPIKNGFDGTKYIVDCADKVCTYKTPNWSLVYIQQFVPLYKNIENVCAGDNDFVALHFKVEAAQCKPEILYGGFIIYENGRIKYTPNKRIWHTGN